MFRLTLVRLFRYTCGNSNQDGEIKSRQDGLLKFKLSIRLRKKGDLSASEYGMVVGDRRAVLSI